MAKRNIRDHGWSQMEFYMKRKGKGYFRNEFGIKAVQLDEWSKLVYFKYGQKYDFEIAGLYRSLDDIPK